MPERRPCKAYGRCISFALARAVCLGLVVALAGCGDDHGSRADDALSRDAERVPTLPGANPAPHTVEPSKAVFAQRFGAGGSAVAPPPASGALLPPVMHSAD